MVCLDHSVSLLLIATWVEKTWNFKLLALISLSIHILYYFNLNANIRLSNSCEITKITQLVFCAHCIHKHCILARMLNKTNSTASISPPDMCTFYQYFIFRLLRSKGGLEGRETLGSPLSFCPVMSSQLRWILGRCRSERGQDRVHCSLAFLRMPLPALCTQSKFCFTLSFWPLKAASSPATSAGGIITLDLDPCTPGHQNPVPMGFVSIPWELGQGEAKGTRSHLPPLHMLMLQWPCISISEHKFKDQMMKLQDDATSPCYKLQPASQYRPDTQHLPACSMMAAEH